MDRMPETLLDRFQQVKCSSLLFTESYHASLRSGPQVTYGILLRGIILEKPSIFYVFTGSNLGTFEIVNRYFSRARAPPRFGSERQFGDRSGVFVPDDRLEVRASHQRLLEKGTSRTVRSNSPDLADSGVAYNAVLVWMRLASQE